MGKMPNQEFLTAKRKLIQGVAVIISYQFGLLFIVFSSQVLIPVKY